MCMQGCVCGRVRACGCVHACVRACRQACACRCGHTCMPSAPSPARPLQRCCSTPWPAALLPAHPTLATPVSPAAGQGWRQHRAAGSPCCARGPCSPAHPIRERGNPQNHSPGSVPGGRAGQRGAWPGAAGAGTLYPLQPPPRGVFDTQRTALTGSGLCARSGKGLRHRACFPGGCSRGWLRAGSAQPHPGDRPHGTGR